MAKTVGPAKGEYSAPKMEFESRSEVGSHYLIAEVKNLSGWSCSSVAECVLGMHKALVQPWHQREKRTSPSPAFSSLKSPSASHGGQSQLLSYFSGQGW